MYVFFRCLFHVATGQRHFVWCVVLGYPYILPMKSNVEVHGAAGVVLFSPILTDLMSLIDRGITWYPRSTSVG